MAIARGLAYRVTRAVLGAAVDIYFRRIEVRHRERVPTSGPLLIASNHPAGLTDVIILGTSLSRRLHFIAMSSLFEPWIRGIGMKLLGALPVYRREDDPRLVARNDETFGACHEILDQGGAVLIFPEGRSETDRRLADMKTGAARLALAQEERPGQAGRLTLLPAGLHFVDRTAFGSDVVLTYGEPIPLAPFRPRAGEDLQEAARRLTGALQSALEQLFLHISEPDVVELVHDLEQLYLEDLKSRGDPRHELELAQRIADCVDWFHHTDPERMFRVWRRVCGYRRMLDALHLDDVGMRELGSSAAAVREAAGTTALAGLGLVPAAVGYLVHYLPYKASARLARLTTDPAQVAQLRIVGGVAFFPLAYAALGLALTIRAGWPVLWIVAALMFTAALGLFALAYARWLARHRNRIRLAFLTLRHRRLVTRLRWQRRSLIRTFDAARAEFRAAAEGNAAPGRRTG
jgi:glycerol-3-phosphate O-acyltransferase / dihydroxyacetone phosphate acyltransferase